MKREEDRALAEANWSFGSKAKQRVTFYLRYLIAEDHHALNSET